MGGRERAGGKVALTVDTLLLKCHESAQESKNITFLCHHYYSVGSVDITV